MVDTSLISAALARLQEAHPDEIVFEFSSHRARNNPADGRDPDEIIMICLDVSLSMDLQLKPEFNKSRARGQQSVGLTRVHLPPVQVCLI